MRVKAEPGTSISVAKGFLFSGAKDNVLQWKVAITPFLRVQSGLSTLSPPTSVKSVYDFEFLTPA